MYGQVDFVKRLTEPNKVPGNTHYMITIHNPEVTLYDILLEMHYEI
jgi:hypothetical protein